MRRSRIPQPSPRSRLKQPGLRPRRSASPRRSGWRAGRAAPARPPERSVRRSRLPQPSPRSRQRSVRPPPQPLSAPQARHPARRRPWPAGTAPEPAFRLALQALDPSCRHLRRQEFQAHRLRPAGPAGRPPLRARDDRHARGPLRARTGARPWHRDQSGPGDQDDRQLPRGRACRDAPAALTGRDCAARASHAMQRPDQAPRGLAWP